LYFPGGCEFGTPEKSVVFGRGLAHVLTIPNVVLSMLVFGVVVLGLLLRGMSSEERLRFGRTILDGLVFIKDAIAKPPSGGDAFYAALKARTRWTLVTPAIVCVSVVIFVLSVLGGGDPGEPNTLIAWGGSVGPRTTNGEWWRLGTAMFVHMGVVHLIAEIAGFVQIGLLVERLVGRLAFTAAYLSAGVLAGVSSLALHAVSVHAGAAGAIFGVYGLLMASLVLGLVQRSSLTVPFPVLKGLWPGVVIFVVYHMLTEGLVSEAMQVGLVTGFVGGLLLGGRLISEKPPVRRVCAGMAATVAIVVVFAAPLRGLADVTDDVARVRAVEERSARSYDAAVDRFKRGRLSAGELAAFADRIVPELQSIQSELASLGNIPPEHWPMIQKASEYLRLRQDSWRLRAEGLRAGRSRTLQEADAAERSALAALDSAIPPIHQ
jgi:rhomboid protease GluP